MRFGVFLKLLEPVSVLKGAKNRLIYMFPLQKSTEKYPASSKTSSQEKTNNYKIVTILSKGPQAASLEAYHLYNIHTQDKKRGVPLQKEAFPLAWEC